ncbi:MAG: cell division protein ZapA [Eubacterium sp.]|nr:cell division protein ZapA [Eubacterium sp.]
MGNNSLSVLIDGKVYRIGGGSEEHLQKVASYVDGKIRELKLMPGYEKLTTEYKDILLAINITEELFKVQEQLDIYNQENLDYTREVERMKHDIVDKDMRIDTANKLVIEYKTKVNDLQKRIIELETRNDLH